jgi:hypothetical protein
MAFFLGDANGMNAHDLLGKQIGEQGRQWTNEFWRFKDMQAYMYLLLLVSSLPLPCLLPSSLSHDNEKHVWFAGSYLSLGLFVFFFFCHLKYLVLDFVGIF